MSEDISVTQMLTKAIAQFTDPYERQARLYPALIALSPLVVLVLSLYGAQLSVLGSAMSALAMCGVLFLFSDFARRKGKAKEFNLWKKWGGKPSTQLLRHADPTFDATSIKRYHAVLAKMTGLDFPSPEAELANPREADDIYTSAGNMLRELARDTKKFNLLFKDNISYGFRRNGLGLKPIGIVVCLTCLFWIVVRHGVGVWATRFHEATDVESFFKADEVASFFVSIAMLFMWLFYFTEKSVRDAAFSYAEKLVLVCESLDRPRKNSGNKS